MYVIFKHRYDHRIKHRSRNKVKVIKERTHRILYWFRVTLHPVPHTSTDFLSKEIFTITPSISRPRGTPLQIHNPLGRGTSFHRQQDHPIDFIGYNHTFSRLIDFTGYNHTFSRLTNYKEAYNSEQHRDLVEIVIDNQTRDDLVRFTGDFGRVIVKIYINK